MRQLKRIGTIRPALPGQAVRLGVGLEKLDRRLYDPAPAYDRVAELGVSYVRIQSGWQRTETAEGVFDFAWLDDIVNALISRGLTPWVNLVYGNPLYTIDAAAVFGAVGCPPIKTAREREAWERYVGALASHFDGRVRLYEIWNEPDGQWCWKHGVNAAEYGAFAKRTARAIRSACRDAVVVGGAVTDAKHLSFIEDALKAGMAQDMDAFSFHRYTPNEDTAADELRALTALVRAYCPHAAIIQGESGGQSSKDGKGAMKGLDWDAEKQRKHLLRQRIVDLSEDLLFTSHFSMLDMAEALNGDNNNLATRCDFGYFGLLSASFDDCGIATGAYTPKPAFFALRALAGTLGDAAPDSAFDETLAFSPAMTASGEIAVSHHAFVKNGRRAVAYWLPVPLMTETYEGETSLTGGALTDLMLVDLRDGSAYDITDCDRLPLTDCPLLLMERGFAPLDA